MSNLFDPITLRDLTIKNRVWVSPMCQYSAIDGVVGDWHMAHLGAFATGEAGLVMAEATGVVPEGRISIACPGIYNDEQIAAFKTINDNGVTEWIGGAELLITGSLVGATMALIWLTPKLTKIIPAPLAAIGLVTAVVIGLDLDVSRVGDLASLSAQSIAAGCDVVLLCNASLDERRAVADAAGRMTPAAQSRAEATLAARQTPDEVDIPALEAHLEALLNGPMHV